MPPSTLEGGTLAIPAASFELRGGVRLGTATPISGSGVLLVGETPNGRLAVNASGLTAYALAVEEGFKGSQEEWLASLKGDMGEGAERGAGKCSEQCRCSPSRYAASYFRGGAASLGFQAQPGCSDGGKVSYCRRYRRSGAATYITLAAQLLPKGRLLSLSLSVPDAVIPTSVDTEHELHAVLSLETGTRTYEWLATSIDTHIVSRATDLTWHFNKVPLDSSAILRINFIRSDNVSHNSTDVGGTAVVYVKLVVAQDASQGETFSGGTWRNWLPKVILTYEADKYAEADDLEHHSANTDVHLSLEERSALSELLANKDALLALISL